MTDGYLHDPDYDDHSTSGCAEPDVQSSLLLESNTPAVDCTVAPTVIGAA